MKYPNIILPLCILTRDCINYLKVNKHYSEGKKLHGAKKTLIRFLLEHYPVKEVTRVLQIYNGGRHCMIKFTFDVMGQIITFHTPSDEIFWDYTLTNEKVRLLIGKIPPDGESHFKSVDEVVAFTKILNQVSMLRPFTNNKGGLATDDLRLKKLVARFEDYIHVLAPKRYA